MAYMKCALIPEALENIGRVSFKILVYSQPQKIFSSHNFETINVNVRVLVSQCSGREVRLI